MTLETTVFLAGEPERLEPLLAPLRAEGLRPRTLANRAALLQALGTPPHALVVGPELRDHHGHPCFCLPRPLRARALALVAEWSSELRDELLRSGVADVLALPAASEADGVVRRVQELLGAASPERPTLSRVMEAEVRVASERLWGSTIDFSLQTVNVALPRPLPRGELGLLVLQLDPEVSLEVFVRVLACRAGGSAFVVSLRFLGLTRTERASLTSLLKPPVVEAHVPPTLAPSRTPRLSPAPSPVAPARPERTTPVLLQERPGLAGREWIIDPREETARPVPTVPASGAREWVLHTTELTLPPRGAARRPAPAAPSIEQALLEYVAEPPAPSPAKTTPVLAATTADAEAGSRLTFAQLFDGMPLAWPTRVPTVSEAVHALADAVARGADHLVPPGAFAHDDGAFATRISAAADRFAVELSIEERRAFAAADEASLDPPTIAGALRDGAPWSRAFALAMVRLGAAHRLRCAMLMLQGRQALCAEDVPELVLDEGALAHVVDEARAWDEVAELAVLRHEVCRPLLRPARVALEGRLEALVDVANHLRASRTLARRDRRRPGEEVTLPLSAPTLLRRPDREPRAARRWWQFPAKDGTER